MIYKVEISGTDKRAIETIPHALIAISLSNPAQKREKLAAIIDWALPRFQGITIDIGDTLARHNNIDACTQQAHNESLSQGDAWLQDNEPFLRGLPVTRWSAYLTRPTFNNELKKSFALCQRHLTLSKGIDADICRLRERRPEIPYDRAQAYLMEEFTADRMTTEEKGPLAFLYPGKPLSFYAYISNAKFVQYRLRKTA